ncbi:MAG: PTS sugar transporter subunit IIA [Phycisphaerales bacterium]|nr:PTS sugar transporter subunit IIA [Phycisphaerales bacterium]
MKLTEIVARGGIIPRLNATTRDEAIAELIDRLIECGAVAQSLRQDLINAIIAREKKGTTGFGKGVALPHVRIGMIKDMVAAVGISEDGIDFNALDREPVYSVFLLLSPDEKQDDHLRAMEIIFKNISQPKFRSFLRQASTTEEVQSLLEDADNQALTG